MLSNRTINAKRNITSGYVNKCISLLLPFIMRTVIIREFGEKYLGLGSLFSSILQVLSMAELGFSSAIVFSLYKPLAEKNTSTVCALLSYYKKIYRIVGSVILVVGILLTPFLPYFIKDEVPSNINIYYLYLIFLINTVISYFAFAYKSSLLVADQRQDLINNINTVILVFSFVIQVLLIFFFKNYYFYAIVEIFSTIFNNLTVAYITKKYYSNYYCYGTLNNSEKLVISTQIKGLAIGKFAKTARNSFDSIVLSSFCGLIEVAIYSNYYYVFNAVSGIALVLLTSISSGIGNSIATESVEKNYDDFKRFNFYFSWISSLFTVCLFCLYQPFMKLWVGEKLMASETVVILFCVYFYIMQLGQVRALYASGAGLWWEFRWFDICEMIGNLILNFVLGYYFKMKGILIATIITVYIFSIIGCTGITFRKYFKTNTFLFHFRNFINLLLTIFICILTYAICEYISIDNLLINLLARFITCMIVSNICLFVFSVTYADYRNYLKGLMSMIVKRN